MESYETVTDAINALKKQGYTEDLNLKENSIEDNKGRHKLSPADFKIDKFFRFEGDSEPDEEAIVYAISSEKYNLKGVLVNAFGIYSDGMANDLIEKLKAH